VVGARLLRATGTGDVNLRQHKFGEPLANPRSKKGERRSQSFTGGDEFTAAARNRGDNKGGRVARARVLAK
jgi:hypothetical protein